MLPAAPGGIGRERRRRACFQVARSEEILRRVDAVCPTLQAPRDPQARLRFAAIFIACEQVDRREFLTGLFLRIEDQRHLRAQAPVAILPNHHAYLTRVQFHERAAREYTYSLDEELNKLGRKRNPAQALQLAHSVIS